MIPKRLQGLKANDAATVDACLADLAATGTPQEFDALLDGVRVERVPVASTLPPAGSGARRCTSTHR